MAVTDGGSIRVILKSISIGEAALVVAAALAVPVARAQAQVVPPQPLAQTQPQLPTNRFGVAPEGWVVLRYTVSTDGHTANVRAIEHMPPSLSEREAVSAAKGWTFEPATADGNPIDWYNNESVVVFDSDAVPFSPTPAFVEAYMETEALIQSGDYDKALKSNERMLATNESRLVEVGIALVQRTVINTQRGDFHAAYAAIVRATDPRVPVLEPTDLKLALQYRNVLELRLGNAVGAVATLERRNALGPVPATDAIAERIAAIADALDGEAAIVIEAEIADDEWRHEPSRRTFAISDVVGEVRRVVVECDRRSTEIEYAPDAEWTLPASWGECSLAIAGRKTRSSNSTSFLERR